MSGIRESNPPPRLGKPVHYRCANSADPEFQSLRSRYPDSNRGPTHYECVALPTEPYRQSFTLCTPAGARTLDTLIKSQVLYQLSYGCILFSKRVQRYSLFFIPPNIFSIFFLKKCILCRKDRFERPFLTFILGWIGILRCFRTSVSSFWCICSEANNGW